MTFPKPKNLRRIIVCIIFIVIYCAGYTVTRQTLLLVHRVGYETQVDGTKYYHHYIDRGEFSRAFILFGNNRNVGTWLHGQQLAYWVFSPLRWSETAVWHLIPRTYEFRNPAWLENGLRSILIFPARQIPSAGAS